MPIEIRELVIRAGVEPEPPNLPDGTPVEIPEMVIDDGVGPHTYVMRELVIRARTDGHGRSALRPGVVEIPEMVIRAHIGPAVGAHPVVMIRELVIRATVPAVNTFARRVPITVVQPSLTSVLGCYGDYMDMPKPCTNPRAVNQCAVRMSTALARCGFPMHSFPDRRRIHRPALCRIQVPHVLGAQELEELLRSRMTGALEYRRHSGVQALAELRDRKGIVFFDRVDGRTDHIDLFDGEKVQNEVLYGPARASTTGYFERAKRITFFPLV